MKIEKCLQKVKNKHRIISVLLCICMLLCICSCTNDTALVICDGKTMLIDGGKPHAGSIIYTYLKNLNIDYLDYIVASHADDDHIGGLSAPLAKMKVGNVLAPETEADTRSYESLKNKTLISAAAK